MQAPVKTLIQLDYSNFFQVFVHIFEIDIIRKTYPKHMDPVTSTEWEKIPCYMLLPYSKMRVLQ